MTRLPDTDRARSPLGKRGAIEGVARWPWMASGMSTHEAQSTSTNRSHHNPQRVVEKVGRSITNSDANQTLAWGALVQSARADVIEPLTVHHRWDRVKPDIQPGLAARAHRDALLVVRDPPHDLVPELPRSLSDAAEQFAALHRRGQHGELLVLWDA
jgi:hypothetical protein